MYFLFVTYLVPEIFLRTHYCMCQVMLYYKTTKDGLFKMKEHPREERHILCDEL